ncbi:hypothetical protein GGI02_003331 [Coemansia sp. RSA 2322]|nr:hypothetical protein GGI02_003331 [Coemansia sp. RSA 2322]
MAKAKHVDKEKLKQVQEIEAQLRASANTASKLVSSWLPDNESDSEDNSGADGKKTATAAATLKPRDVFKGRPARLGVGAKFLSHKEMMANSQSGPGILSAEELSLKRKLTRGKPSAADDDKRLQLDKRKVAEEEDDDLQ